MKVKARFDIRLKPELLKKFRAVASERGTTMTKLMEDWIEGMPGALASQSELCE